MRQPTVEDVARIAQVSRQTVSNVLNSPAIVKLATRTRVQAAIAELGYRPNLSARRLRQQKSATLGIRLDPMMNGISGAVLDRFLHALTEQADARGLRILLFTAATPEEEIEQIRRLREAAEVDAFVLTATFHEDPRTEWLIANRIPFVTFGRPWGIDDMTDPQHLWVDVDGRQGVYDATISLLDQGARRVGWLGWPRPSGTGDDRRSGWEDAMRERLGLGEAELRALCTESHDGVPQATAAVVAALVTGRSAALAGNVAKTGASAAVAEAGEGPDDFGLDALVCASDTLALGALIATSSAGLRDLPIIGFDDTPVAAAVGLSSVMQPLDEVAAGALELLLGPTGNTVGVPNLAPNEAHRLIAPRLVKRRSNHLPLSEPSPSLTR
ncbi:LacI family transcriptional regulator [Cryobacterium sp. Hh7]|uniref:LacI family DNA-binding transcriptional regulator n=1 Tax=Cryobacterium sp. Hh7 TaxID=1259159 RepID=UPI00106CBDD0|nr:LacI family DNA-binding transcriptional regulator [Cryobacterium sp. Hh7]TFD56242.1 LacI family transcriptional regulator [Cryobacterium sp. Hh7]